MKGAGKKKENAFKNECNWHILSKLCKTAKFTVLIKKTTHFNTLTLSNQYQFKGISVLNRAQKCKLFLVRPTTGYDGPDGEYRYSSTLSLTLALDWGGWSTPRPGRFTRRKETWYPLYRRLSGPQGRSGRVRKISLPTGIQSPDCPARGKSLYRLHYPGPRNVNNTPIYFKYFIWSYIYIYIFGFVCTVN